MNDIFRTVIPIKPSSFTISHSSAILSIGSCFAENIGTRLKAFRFPIISNPTGILFNPASIATCISRLIDKKQFSKEDLFEHEGVWKSFDHHSSFASPDPDLAVAMIQKKFQEASAHLERCNLLMLTFGTAVTYWHKTLGRTVANCHKLPHDIFERRMLTTQEMVKQYENLFSLLLNKNPALNIIVTVSPVRHLRDDPHENLVSKSRLIAAVYELEQLFHAAYYFPSYEIMMDELRDYRFYGPDMAHPTDVAIDYIWERFGEACISQRARAFIHDFRPIRRDLDHRVKNSETHSTVAFKKHIAEELQKMEKQYPEIDMQKIMKEIDLQGSAHHG